MKKILFVIHELSIGGIQQSLLNLISEIKEQYEITLMIFHLREDDEKRIPDGIRVITVNSPFKHLGISMTEAKQSPFLLISHSFWQALTKSFGRSKTIRLMCLFQKKLDGFDIAVSYVHEAGQKNMYGGCNEFVLRKTGDSRKITWLHCDFRRTGAAGEQAKKIYHQFDEIVACSKGCREAFLEVMPDLNGKTIAVPNCHQYSIIHQKAAEGYCFDKRCFNVVTVARLSEVKGIERAIEAVWECAKHGYSIHYYLVGSGKEESHLKELVINRGMENNVIFLGNQDNPYYYIKNADLFLLTSYHEAAPMVFDECACLGVPVLATATTSTTEMILDKHHGIVCDNNQQAITKSLLEVVQDRSPLTRIRESLGKEIFTNARTIDEIHKVFG